VQTSDTIAKLAPALVAAQASLGGITKDAANPHFRSRYASLDGIMAVVRPGLAAHGLAVVQGVTSPIETAGGTLHAVAVVTRLIHTSGEWVESRVIVPIAKLDPQGAGAAVTYGRRYALSALLALATEEDDDGESAMPSRNAPTTARTGASRSNAAPAASKAASGAHGGKVMPFGKKKGTPLADLAESELTRTLDWCAEKGKFDDLQSDIRAELARRGGSAPSAEPDWDAPPPPVDDLPF
jgi:hypothetical protein